MTDGFGGGGGEGEAGGAHAERDPGRDPLTTHKDPRGGGGGLVDWGIHTSYWGRRRRACTGAARPPTTHTTKDEEEEEGDRTEVAGWAPRNGQRRRRAWLVSKQTTTFPRSCPPSLPRRGDLSGGMGSATVHLVLQCGQVQRLLRARSFGCAEPSGPQGVNAGTLTWLGLNPPCIAPSPPPPCAAQTSADLSVPRRSSSHGPQ